MPKRFPKEVRETAGALLFAGLDSGEILRRLNEDQAGLGYKCPIKYRRLREYLTDYETEHGPPPEPDYTAHNLDSIGKLKQRITARLAKEVAHYERKQVGKLKPADSVLLGQLMTTLDGIEVKELRAAKRKRPPSTGEDSEDGAEETAIERLAREEAETALSEIRQLKADEAQQTSPLHAAPDPPQEEAA